MGEWQNAPSFGAHRKSNWRGVESEFMNAVMKVGLAGLVSVMLLAGCDVGINRTVHIEAADDAQHGAASINGDVIVSEKAIVRDGDLKTVNGTIEIKHGARVNRCATVNGSLRIEAEAQTGDLESVNGHLNVDRDATVRGNIKLVNGGVTLKNGASVSGSVGTVNGAIELYGATVEGMLQNYNGGMTVTAGSLVKGGISVHRSGRYDRSMAPTIVIGPGSSVEGILSFGRPVRLYIHDTASVGQIRGAEPIRYSGELPAEG